MRRAYIMIELKNGVRIKYVRDIVADTNGINKLYYAYTGETNDALVDQTGAGKVMGDFETIITNSQSTTEDYLSFPESGGAVYLLERNFYDQGLGRDSIMINYIRLDSITRIYLVEEWMNIDQNI